MTDNQSMVQMVAIEGPVGLRFDPKGDPSTGASLEAYLRFAQANPDLRIERMPDGEVIIMPPAGGESSYRSSSVDTELRLWARRDGRGKSFDSSVQFVLPNGAGLSPDASWVSKESLAKLDRSERREFLRLVPEFVVEVMSPSDRLKDAREKMEQWLAAGVQLGWLIDGDRKTIYVYRADGSCEVKQNLASIDGEGPVAGFVLELAEVWQGLE